MLKFQRAIQTSAVGRHSTGQVGKRATFEFVLARRFGVIGAAGRFQLDRVDLGALR